MALVSQGQQRLRLLGLELEFAPGEALITEYSYKFSPQAFIQLAAAAGWTPGGAGAIPLTSSACICCRPAFPQQTAEVVERTCMGREEQRALVRRVRESLIGELEQIYRRAFDAIGTEDLGEGTVARLTQLLLRSREGQSAPWRRRSRHR